MPDEPLSEATFASGEARMDVLMGLGFLLYGLLSLLSSGYLWVVFGVFGAYSIWRGVRSWRKPYITLNREGLVVFDHGRPMHYVPCAAIATVEPGFNSTRLRMRDGLKISISHLSFVSRADIERLRGELGNRVSVKATSPTVDSAGRLGSPR